MQIVATLFTLAAAASAIQIDAPTLNAQWDLSGSNDVKWSGVSSDPTSFNIYLVNNGATPPSSSLVAAATNTPGVNGSYTITNFVDTPGDDYVVKLVSNSTENTGALAQSQQFNVTKSGVEATTTTSSAGASATATSSSASTSASATKNAGAVGKTFGVAAPLAALLAMLL